MPLTNGSGSCYFRHWPSRHQQKTTVIKKKVFLLIAFEGTFTLFFKDKKSTQNSRNQGCSYYICLMRVRSGSRAVSGIHISEAQKHVDPVDSGPEHWFWPIATIRNKVRHGQVTNRERYICSIYPEAFLTFAYYIYVCICNAVIQAFSWVTLRFA
jgi:hypothetical protein